MGIRVTSCVIGALISTVVCPSASSLLAQQETPLQPDTVVADRFFDRVPVSGGIRVGIMASVPPAPLNPVLFYAFVPYLGAGRLCVEISSRDGRYDGRFEYTLGPEVIGRVPVQVSTRHRAMLASSYASDELAILARVATDCDASDGMYIVTSWARAADRGNVIVLLNSRVPTVLASRRGRRIVDEASCAELPGSSIAFNLQCSVPVEWFAPPGDIIIRRRQRRGGRVTLSDIELPIRVLSPPR